MKEIRLHGRGGQGVVTAAELIAQAAFADGKYSLAFPSFGSERMGAPVQSFVRISDDAYPGQKSDIRTGLPDRSGCYSDKSYRCHQGPQADRPDDYR